MRGKRALAVTALAAGMLGLGRPAAAGKLPAPVRVTLSAKTLTTIPLPAMPLGITAHEGTLWVVGADEMVAHSVDGGQTWQIDHYRKHGQLLFAITFAGNDAWAMGSQGIGYRSKDDGAHWKHMFRAPGNIMALAAGDERHLMASTPETFLFSGNGGRNWTVRSVRSTRTRKRRMAVVSAIAIVDGRHAGALIGGMIPEESKGVERFVYTGDGGRSWRIVAFPKRIHLDSLGSESGGYFGLGTRESGGGAQGVVFHSPDGAQWSSAPNKLGVTWCEGAQCLLAGGNGWVETDGARPVYWGIASRPGLATHWAAVPGVFCAVGIELHCIGSRRLAKAPAKPAINDWRAIFGAMPKQMVPGKCHHCAGPRYPVAEKNEGISGMVLLEAVIGRSGRVRAMALLAAPSPGLARRAMRTVQGWRFQPTTIKGKVARVMTLIEVNFHLGR